MFRYFESFSSRAQSTGDEISSDIFKSRRSGSSRISGYQIKGACDKHTSGQLLYLLQFLFPVAEIIQAMDWFFGGLVWRRWSI